MGFNVHSEVLKVYVH